MMKNLVFKVLLLFPAIITFVLKVTPNLSTRPISKIENTAVHLIQSGNITGNDRLVVLALKRSETKTPQADDYRSLLRVNGYRVSEVSNYDKSDKLIIFVEDTTLDWEGWRTYETEFFGG